jgi:hypothetical protein
MPDSRSVVLDYGGTVPDSRSVVLDYGGTVPYKLMKNMVLCLVYGMIAHDNNIVSSVVLG